jgi:hypothetical protein
VYSWTNPILAAAAADLSQQEYCRIMKAEAGPFDCNMYEEDIDKVRFVVKFAEDASYDFTCHKALP